MGPPASRRVPRARRYSGTPRPPVTASTARSPPLVRLSRRFEATPGVTISAPATPGRSLVWAHPRSLAATDGIEVSFFSSRYLDVSVPCVRFHALCIRAWIPFRVGFPIQTSQDQSLVASSPGLIAGSHVFHRLSTPRHPPYALSSLVTPTCDRSRWDCRSGLRARHARLTRVDSPLSPPRRGAVSKLLRALTQEPRYHTFVQHLTIHLSKSSTRLVASSGPPNLYGPRASRFGSLAFFLSLSRRESGRRLFTSETQKSSASARGGREGRLEGPARPERVAECSDRAQLVKPAVSGSRGLPGGHHGGCGRVTDRANPVGDGRESLRSATAVSTARKDRRPPPASPRGNPGG